MKLIGEEKRIDPNGKNLQWGTKDVPFPVKKPTRQICGLLYYSVGRVHLSFSEEEHATLCTAVGEMPSTAPFIKLHPYSTGQMP